MCVTRVCETEREKKGYAKNVTQRAMHFRRIFALYLFSYKFFFLINDLWKNYNIIIRPQVCILLRSPSFFRNRSLGMRDGRAL